ncbi:MAG TPA: GNAT family protein [Microthrixaceae bacterium]|nr:GNAT family protein [Microthrixaceae bacterium]
MWSKRSTRSPSTAAATTTLIGRRLLLRPLVVNDFDAWREVRRRCHDWLTKWEPSRLPGAPDSVESRQAFGARCGARAREIQLGTGYGFGIFVDGRFGGEINLNSIHRGAFQSGYVGYWIDEALAGHSYMPEAVVLLLRFGFDQIGLHRLQISIIPRNTPSRRVVEKLGLRNEGVAERYLEINGVWEDHIRYAITVEEWEERRDELIGTWAY